jgi:hypothetical protein
MARCWSIGAAIAVLALAGSANCPRRHQEREASAKRRVEVNFRVIKYWEGEEFLQLNWEPRQGEPPIAYVPSERLWDEVMPDWAVRRRDEIMRIIKTETAHMRFEWHEYDSVR